MATKRKTRKSGSTRQVYLGTPNGVIQPRVEDVGPERFGVVAVDCAKARARWLMSDFYGRVLVEPATVEVTRGHLQAAVLKVRRACETHRIEDLIVAVEMTGTYHRPVQRAFREAGFETRLVHPFASKHYRRPAHPDVKTDDNDLEAIFRAAINGFGLLEPEVDDHYVPWKLRAIWMLVADNLVKCNAHFRGKCRLGRQQNGDARDVRARVANRATRVVFQIVSGGKVFQHPSGLDRHYLMDKLMANCREHGMAPQDTLRVLHAAAGPIPESAKAEEAARLKETFRAPRRKSRNEPEPLGNLLVAVRRETGCRRVTIKHVRSCGFRLIMSGELSR